jgi:uncharacterized protein YdaU (DUF1376 family)
MMAQPWYRRFPDNFLGGTNGMTLEEKGAYSVVIDMIYQRGGPIADEPRYIAGICNCSVRKWNAIRQRLISLGKLEASDGHLMNARAEIELEKAAKAAREHAENGAKGGDKSAEMKAEANKNNALGQARLKHTRATSTSTPFKKEGARASGPTEGTARVDKFLEPELWAALFEAMPDGVPKWAEHWSWPAKLVAETRGILAAKAAA